LPGGTTPRTPRVALSSGRCWPLACSCCSARGRTPFTRRVALFPGRCWPLACCWCSARGANLLTRRVALSSGRCWPLACSCCSARGRTPFTRRAALFPGRCWRWPAAAALLGGRNLVPPACPLFVRVMDVGLLLCALLALYSARGVLAVGSVLAWRGAGRGTASARLGQIASPAGDAAPYGTGPRGVGWVGASERRSHDTGWGALFGGKRWRLCTVPWRGRWRRAAASGMRTHFAAFADYFRG
jgi:hypothetical protein